MVDARSFQEDGTAPDRAWLNPALEAARRADLLLAAMGEADRIALALGDFGTVEHLGIPALSYADGPNGVRGADGATSFPSGLSLAATFDRDLAEAFGAAVGREVCRAGHNVWLAPALDLARVPVGGRVGEALGEDPRLTGEMGAAIIRGARSSGVVPAPKHYLVNNFETDRTGHQLIDGRSDAVDIRLSAAVLRDLYLAPFLAAAAAGMGCVMGSYNRINGEYACQNQALLDLLKVEGGWPGAVVPDFLFAVRDPVAAAIAGTDIPALGGPGGLTASDFLTGAVSLGRLEDICRRILWMMFDGGLFDRQMHAGGGLARLPAHVDLATRIAQSGTVLLRNNGVLPLGHSVRSIAVIGAAGEDAQYVVGGSAAVSITDATRSTPLDGIRLRAGVGCRVMHEPGTPGDVILADVPNDAWTPSDASSAFPGIGVVAEYWRDSVPAGEPVLRRLEPGIAMHGSPIPLPPAWSARWRGRLRPRTTGLHRFSVALAGEATLRIDGTIVAQGSREAVTFFDSACPLSGLIKLSADEPVDVEITYATAAAIDAPGTPMDGPSLRLGWLEPADGIQRAARVAADADVAIIFAGFASSEGMDRQSLSLPGSQDALILAVAAANPRTIVVLNGGGASLMPWLDNVAAVLEAWLPGERFGAAIAGVLFGDADPGGRTPVTFPMVDRSSPVNSPVNHLGEGSICRYDEGHLIGYRWYDASGETPAIPFGHGLSYATFERGQPVCALVDDGLSVTLPIENVSDRAGSDVIQAYIEGPPRPGRPPRTLIDFAKVTLQPGESGLARLLVTPSALRAYDEELGEYLTPAGEYRLVLATSSRAAFATVLFAIDDSGMLIGRSVEPKPESRGAPERPALALSHGRRASSFRLHRDDFPIVDAAERS